ncbi:MAG: glycosyltransferase [Gemmatimonadota bacterium]|nr:MAG: glycosyltransferase [Gemmatimonadota bacterium]
MPLSDTVLLAVYGALMIVLSPFSLHAYLMVLLHSRRKARSPSPDAPDMWPVVTVQLPIYNERYVVRRLIEAVCDLDYPRGKLEIQVLDDSTDDTRLIVSDLVSQYRLEGIDITHIHRTDRAGFKAGALKAGLEAARGEFLAIFDADFVPPADFLRRTLPYFHDAGVAVTQARWGHLNREYSLLTRAMAIGLDAHFVLEHGARNAHGLFINFNGTAGVWRKAAVLDAGNWQADTLTEDVDISYRAQLREWRLVYLNDIVCDGEIPAEVQGLKTQQYRWAKGQIQTAKKLLPKIWSNRTLSPLTKWEATTHLTNHIVFPVMLLLFALLWPMLTLKVGQDTTPLYFAATSVFLVLSGSYPLFYAYAQREIYDDWKRRLLYVPLFMAFAVGMSVVNSKAVFSAFLNRKSPFVRTPKYRLDDRTGSWRSKKYRGTMDATVVVELALAVYFAAGIWYAATQGEFAAIPFMLLPAVGFGGIGGLSALQAIRPRGIPSIQAAIGSRGLETAESLE